MQLGPMILLLPLVLLANWNETPTGLDVNKLRPFPMTRVHSGTLKEGETAEFDGIRATASVTVREVLLRGTGNSGKPWTVRIFALDEIWKADLDGNGVSDYLLFGPGPFLNGRLTPTYSISVLLMDSDHMPVPFFESVYNREDAPAMKHFVDLDGDGKAEWIASRYSEGGLDSNGDLFGHWVHQLYRFRNLAAEDLRGVFGGIRFPLVHRWTYGATQPKPSVPPALENRQTIATGAPVTRFLGPQGLEFGIEPVAGCKLIDPKVIVVDQPRMREILFPNLTSDSVANLAAEIRRTRARVELRGIDRLGAAYCRVNIAWANIPR